MKRSMRNAGPRSSLAMAALLAVAGCGGGGGGGSGGFFWPVGGSTVAPPAPAPNPSTGTTLSGVAATGAPFAGAEITVTDAGGTTVCTTQTDTGGAYTCPLPAATQAPLVIRALRDDQVLYGAAVRSSGIANVTPLTNIVVARLSPAGNPAQLAGVLSSRPEILTADSISQQVAALKTALQPVLDSLGLALGHPLLDALVADGTGQDRLLDVLSVSVRPDGEAANIEITVKTADGTPVSVRFRSGDSSIPPIDAGVEVADAPPLALVAELLRRFTDCYALPLTQRVSTATDDDTDAVGGPSAVAAPACRQLFLDDDPSTFYSNGANVGRSSANAGAYASLFRASARGLRWERGSVEFFRPNGDMVLSYRTTDPQGNTAFDLLGARRVGNTLKLVGNGNAYRATVQPYAQLREFLNTPAFSNYGTGYDVTIPNLTDGAGNPVFAKAVVTTPWGTPLTFLPGAGYSTLRFARANGAITGSSVYRLRGEYRSTETPGNPSTKETSLTYAQPQLDDAQIRAIADQGIWTVEFHHADTTKPNVVQTARTLSRALTMAELRQQPLAQLSGGLRDFLATGSTASGYLLVANPIWVNFSSPPGDKDGWSVPAGAPAPTQLSVFGNAPFGSTTPGANGAGFNDSATFPSSARRAVVYCSRQTSADRHCDTTDPTMYAKNSTINSFLLQATNQKQVAFSSAIALYKLQ